ncbi:MAG: sulfatase [Rhodopirellula sp. JB055]|uniref:sulfatase n=1 Tax=Rhodopirellula sp. JB055 TaxID=3342846 RepID=UPI00370A9BCB
MRALLQLPFSSHQVDSPLVWILRSVIVTLVALASTINVFAEKPKNVLLICVDDLRPELGCYGADYISSPNIDSLAAKGIQFNRHFVQAPTCGASRFAMLTGCYGPSGNHALFSRAKQIAKDPSSVTPSMPRWFRDHGYTSVSVGKVSHHPGGRGGADWNEEAEIEMPGAWDRHLMPTGPWQHPRGSMHGLADGEIRKDASQMDVFQSAGGEAKYPDDLILETSLDELATLAKDAADKPFFLAVGFIRPHLPFGAPAEHMEPYQQTVLPVVGHPSKPSGQTTWHRSGEFMRYNRWGKDPNQDTEFAEAVRRHYAACVSYADANVGEVLKQLDELGLRESTVVVVWGDHGWHLGEHAIWGKHALFEESLHSPLIIHDPSMKSANQTDAIVETIDVFPTLCELTNLPSPPKVDGESLVPVLKAPASSEGEAVSYAKATTIRTSTHRLISHPKGFHELYNHETDPGETKNIAEENPELVHQLQQRLKERLANRQSF